MFYFSVMTFFEFIKLDASEKLEAVWSGVYVGAKDVDHFHVLLYQINDFYAEVFYDSVLNEIESVRHFRSTIMLDPYLDEINITELVNECL